jgi:hypothetical protein
MAIVDGYISVIEFQAFIDVSGQAKWTNADVIWQENSIRAASRWIDNHCNTRFYTYTTTAADETRYFDATHPTMFYIPDDLVAITSIKIDDDDDGTYEITLTSSDYILKPLNADDHNQPYRIIEMDDDSSYSWPTGTQKGIEIVGRFGYQNGLPVDAPQPVRQATFTLAHEFWKMRNRPSGGGTNPTGASLGLSAGTIAMVAAMLSGVSGRGGFF